MRLREGEELFFKVVMVLATATVFLCLALIIGAVFVKGIGALNLDIITKTPMGGFYLGKEGGVLNAIAGSLMVTGGAVIVSLVISLPVVFYLNVYGNKSSVFPGIIRLCLDFLWGVPSIVYGAFGFTIMVFFGIKASLLGGIIAVSLLIFPIMSRAMDEVVRMVPGELLDASYSLGATKFETAMRVIVRQTMPGMISAVLIAFGRGIGDAASVLFTAGFTDRIPRSLSDPAATLPLAVFFQMGTPFPEVQERAYASAFILTAIILIVSIIARVLASRFNKHVVGR